MTALGFIYLFPTMDIFAVSKFLLLQIHMQYLDINIKCSLKIHIRERKREREVDACVHVSVSIE